SGLLLAAPLPLITREEKRLVLFDWPAKHAPKLVSPERWFLRRKKIASVQWRVAVKLPYRTVKSIRARLRGHDDLTSGLPAVFGRVRTGQNLEFADRIENRPVQRLIRCLVVVIDTVEEI